MRGYIYKVSVAQTLNPFLLFPRNQLSADGPGGRKQRSDPSSRELRGSLPAHPAPDPHQPQQEVPLQDCSGCWIPSLSPGQPPDPGPMDPFLIQINVSRLEEGVTSPFVWFWCSSRGFVFIHSLNSTVTIQKNVSRILSPLCSKFSRILNTHRKW